MVAISVVASILLMGGLLIIFSWVNYMVCLSKHGRLGVCGDTWDAVIDSLD